MTHSGSPSTRSPAMRRDPPRGSRGRSPGCFVRVQVALLADRHQRRPAGRDQRRPGRLPRERRRAVEAARPVGGGEVLVAAQLEAAVEHHRGALGRVAVLVGVGRHRRHARQAEVERRHRVAELLGPRQHEPAEAGVGVEADAALPGQLARAPDRVDHAVRERRRRADDDDGVLGDGRGSMAATSARQSGPTGTCTMSMPKYCAALSKAGVGAGGRRSSAARVMPGSLGRGRGRSSWPAGCSRVPARRHRAAVSVPRPSPMSAPPASTPSWPRSRSRTSRRWATGRCAAGWPGS